MQEIERDLVRWPRQKWLAIIFFIFAVQIGLMIWASQKQLRERSIYPSEPKVVFSTPGQMNRQWLELENPFLFAGASWNGFSGEAWLRKPNWTVPSPKMKSNPSFLQLAEGRKITSRADAGQSFAFARARRPGAELPMPGIDRPARKQTSELELTGFKARQLAAPLPVPVQFHSDVLSSSVVEAMIDRDGLVISARLIDNSGSAKADAEALALARRARFTPSKTMENVPEVGKLIFEWFTLHLSDTNNVNR
jgi:TonB family protein